MLLKVKDAAEYLGLSQSFLDKDRSGRALIPFVKLGKTRGVRYRQEDLDAFIESRKFCSTSGYVQEK